MTTPRCPWCGEHVLEDDDCHGPADYCDHPLIAPLGCTTCPDPKECADKRACQYRGPA